MSSFESPLAIVVGEIGGVDDHTQGGPRFKGATELPVQAHPSIGGDRRSDRLPVQVVGELEPVIDVNGDDAGHLGGVQGLVERGSREVAARATTSAATAIGLLASVMRDPTAAWSNWRWLVGIGLVLVAAWLSYRSAIESALAHASDVEGALDLYRDLLLDASRMAPSPTLAEEKELFVKLSKLYTARSPDHGVDYPLVPRRLRAPHGSEIS